MNFLRPARWPIVLVGVVSLCVELVAPRPCRADASAAAAVSRDAEVAAATISLPDGYAATPIASEPQLANPVAFCFDPAGRIFVAETHRVYKGVEDNRGHMDWLDDDLAAQTVADRRAFMIRRMGDQIHRYTDATDQVRLLEDRDGDGQYEWSSVYSTGYDNVEDGAAAGVMWVDDRLLLTCIPSLWELRDADGDGHAEQKRALATGFGVHVALFGHDLHGLCEGPDGKIYFSIGDRGLHVETSDGALVNPNSGAVLRCNRDGSGLEFFATGLRNPQELAFNELGDLFTVDNNSDSGDRARLVHIVEGMQAGWRMSYQYLPDRGPFNRERIWQTANRRQPAAIVPPLAHISDGPSGLVRYPGTGLPAENDGAFFLCDFRGMPGSSGVRRFWVEPDGATYRLKHDEMWAKGVLATDCDFGPDGALYVADWIDGWSGQGAGRIHRVASDDAAAVAEGRATQQVLRGLPRASAELAIEMLEHPDMRVRMGAQRRLATIGAEAIPRLQQRAAGSSAGVDQGRAGAEGTRLRQLGRIHAIWALGELAVGRPELFSALVPLCQDLESEIRAQTARTLGRAAALAEEDRAALGEALVPLLADNSPRARCQAAIALGKLRRPEALAGLLEMARDNVEGDATLRHAAAVGLAGTQAPAELVAAAEQAGDRERLAIVVALGRQRSPHVAKFLRDDAPAVRLEAARAIWDTPIPESYGDLAAILAEVPSTDEPLLRRSLAACSLLGGGEHAQSLIQCGLRGDLSRLMHQHIWELIGAWSSPSPRDPVHGEWRLSRPRPAGEAALAVRSTWAQLAEASAKSPLALVVAAELGVTEALEPLIPVIASADHSPALRARAVWAFAHAEEPVVREVAEAALGSKSPELRSAGRRLLVERFPQLAAESLREAAESASMVERQSAIDQLAELDVPAAEEAIASWLGRVEEGSCPPELELEVLEAATKSRDTSLVARQQAYQERLAQVGPAATYRWSLHGGDAERGRKIFQENAALSCRRCHGTDAGDVMVGPNLADVGVRLSREELLESIVAPNAKIAEGFQTTTFLLDTGQAMAGIIRREDEKQAVIVDADAKEHVIDLAAIEVRSVGLSAMPEDLMKLMTPRDLRDLVEYLSGLRSKR